MDIDGYRWCNYMVNTYYFFWNILQDVKLLQLVHVVIHWRRIVLAPDLWRKNWCIFAAVKTFSDVANSERWRRWWRFRSTGQLGLDELDVTGRDGTGRDGTCACKPSINLWGRGVYLTGTPGIQNHTSPEIMNIFFVGSRAPPSKS